jgi:hypothetical protein
MGDRGLDFLPRQARGQNRQGPAKVNHLVQAATEKIVSDGRHVKPQKLPETLSGIIGN